MRKLPSCFAILIPSFLLSSPSSVSVFFSIPSLNPGETTLNTPQFFYSLEHYISMNERSHKTNSYIDEATSHRDRVSNHYARNGKIMLSAVIIFFAVIILILCFHSYGRWYFQRRARRARRRFRARLRSLSVTAASKSPGLQRSAIESIPKLVYSSERFPSECAVCLSEFEEKDECRVLPKCCHIFHVECIDSWLRNQSNCPLCRAPILAAEPVACSKQSLQPTDQPPRPREDAEKTQTSLHPPTLFASSSSPSSGLPVERCGRQGAPALVGIVIEVPRSLDGMNPGSGSRNETKL